jgi:hypothetical protein
MSDYYPERRRVHDTFWIEMTKTDKAQCTIFERWAFEKGGSALCGTPGHIKVGRTKEESKSVSTTIESSIEGTLGPLKLLQLKAGIKATLGYEVKWNRAKTEEVTYDINPPKCGSTKISVYQKVREYELQTYHLGGRIFRPKVWDMVWADTVMEELGDYLGIPTTEEWDESCRCEVKPPSPAFDGRLSLDLGTLNLLVPYQITIDELKIRIERLNIVFPIYNYLSAMNALQRGGLTLTLQRSFIPPIFLFLGNLEGESFQASARIYKDAGTESSEPESPYTIAEARVEDMGLKHFQRPEEKTGQSY